MYRYNLAPYLVDCPKEWQHFIYWLRAVSTRPVPRRFLDKELKKFGGVKFDKTEDTPPYVIFEGEEDFLAFKLKWL